MTDTTIVAVHGRRVWDSRGRPTVEAEIRLAGGAMGRAIAPAGASTGAGEALERRDGGTRLGGRDVREAVAAIDGEIAAALSGMDAADQAAIDALVAAIERAGFTPGEQIALSLDIAASEFHRDGRYVLALDGRVLDSDGMAEMLIRWLERYPIVSIEDPLAENDPDGLRRFTAAVGERVQIVGDDFLVTDAARVRRAAAFGVCNAVLVKPNQAGTISEAKAA